MSAAGLVFCLVLLTAPAPPAQGRAQEPSATLSLAGQPVWHDEGDRLDLRLRIRNSGTAPLAGLRLTVAVNDPVSNRSALHDSFDDTPFTFNSFSVSPNALIEPGGQETIVVDEPLGSLAPLNLATEAAVYPLTVFLYDSSGTVELDHLNVPLILYPSDPEPKLNLAFVVPLDEIATRGPDRVFTDDPLDDTAPLEEGLEGSGWLTGLIGALRSGVARGLHASVAPTPRLVEELADMANGYERERRGRIETVGSSAAPSSAADQALDDLRDLLDGRAVQGVLAPYASPDLPALVAESGTIDDVERQMSIGEATLREILRTDFPSRWLFPPAGRLDAATIAELQLGLAGGMTNAFFVEDSLESPPSLQDTGCPENSPSFTCPISVAGEAGEVRGYLADPGLEDRFADLIRPGNDALDLQRFFAETAMIRQELPANGDRVVQTTLPSLWHPKPALSRRLMMGLVGAPWVDTVTADEGLRASRRTESQRVVSSLERGADEPDSAFYDRLATIKDAIEHYASIGPPPERLRRLRHSLLVAESRSWWNQGLIGRAYSFIEEVSDEIEAELDKISISGKDAVTLSSRRGSIPFALSNQTGYPVTLRLTFASDTLDLDDPNVERTFSAEDQEPLEIEATARASGVSVLQVFVETPDGTQVDRQEITIRSTELNRVALGITLGALSFVVLFYSIRVLRGRGNRRDEDAAGTKTA